MAKSDSEYASLVARVEALERAVFLIDKPKTTPRKEAFSGATGGLRLLLTDGFFDRRRRFAEIADELKKRGYHYSRQAIQTPLNRLSTQRGPLVGLNGEGRKEYAKRK
jgi:hypothetical protein